MDLSMLEYFDHLCYEEEVRVFVGSMTYFGGLALASEYRGHAPKFSHAPKGWRKLSVTSEGGPVLEEVVFAIAAKIIKFGHVEEAVWVFGSNGHIRARTTCRTAAGSRCFI